MKLLLIIVVFLIFTSFSEGAIRKNGQKKKRQKSKLRKSRNNLQNKSRFGGDMMGLQRQKGVLRSAGQTITSRLWPGGVVFYQISKNAFDTYEEREILSTMKYIQSVTCVKFKKRTNESNFINLVKSDGCYSYVGMIGGSQDVSIGNGCCYKGTIIHELMHALGFYHEHMRSDRDSYLKIHFNNVIPGMNTNFEKVPNYLNHLYTKFDCNSIMIYSSTAFSKNGQDTMDPKDKKCVLTDPYNKQKMTQLDIVSIKSMYKCK